MMVQIPETSISIPDSRADIGLLRPPLAAKPPLPLKLEPLSEGVNKYPDSAALAVGAVARRRARQRRASPASGALDVARYGRVLRRARSSASAAPATAFDGTYYVKSVTHNHQARRVQAELHAGAQRHSTPLRSTVHDMNRQEALVRQVPRHRRCNNIDPKQIGRILVEVPDVLGPASSSWAMPCLPMAGMQTGMFLVPPMARAYGSSSSKATPTTRSGSAASGHAGEVPALATATPPAVGVITLQTQLQNALMLSATCPADRRHPWS